MGLSLLNNGKAHWISALNQGLYIGCNKNLKKVLNKVGYERITSRKVSSTSISQS